MNEIATNRDLYLSIAGLVKRHTGTSITLEQYLTNLRQLGRAQRSLAALPLERFARLLEAAFEPPGPSDAAAMTAADGFAEWESRISAQIRDLREMQEDGTLANEYRSLGVSAPSGAQWYNFDSCTFLECAVAGTFGGWQEDDDTGRGYVPGPVAVLDASGAVSTVDPRDIEDPVIELPEVSWPEFVEFLEAGQTYE